MALIEKLRQTVPLLQDSTKIEIINKGFSSDIKYVVHDKSGEKFLLRTAAIDQFPRKKEEFHRLWELQSLEVQSQKPLDIGEIPELEICYYILTFIDGDDARDLLPLYDSGVQYNIGVIAGRDLEKINRIHAPSFIGPWDERKLRKFYRYFEAYKTCGIKIEDAHRVLEFIERNVGYLRNRPNRFLHDDFHVGNLIVKDAQYAGVIDFNRFDWGDPYLEFLKIGLFSREVSIPFSIGQIHGYFKQKIPGNFWRLYSTYLAMELFSAIVWTKKVLPEKLDEMLSRIDMILEDHKGFELIIPSWYRDLN